MKELFRNEIQQSQCVLENFLKQENVFDLLQESANIMIESLLHGGKIISCGNGGSMTDAMHFAEELTGRFRENRPSIPAVAISDPSFLTCVANDYGFDKVFSRFVEGVGKEGDVLLAISTSGNSTNVIEAVKTAKEKGIFVVALSGETGGKLKAIADVCLCVPHNGYADRIQEIHIKIIHALIHVIEQALEL